MTESSKNNSAKDHQLDWLKPFKSVTWEHMENKMDIEELRLRIRKILEENVLFSEEPMSHEESEDELDIITEHIMREFNYYKMIKNNGEKK